MNLDKYLIIRLMSRRTFIFWNIVATATMILEIIALGMLTKHWAMIAYVISGFVIAFGARFIGKLSI